MIKKCLGCGLKLQTTHQEKPGYIPKEKIAKSHTCARCFKINHYNQIDLTSIPIDNATILKTTNQNNYLALFLTDILNINEETISKYHKIKTKKLLLISKSDIIPKSINLTKIITNLKTIYHIQEDIIIFSTKKNINTKFIEELSNKHQTISLLGYTNAGKSTYLNYLINTMMNKSLKITTSMIPNTTLDFIRINLTDNLTIIDSPGFNYQSTIYKPNEIDLIKRINPKNFLRPLNYQLKPITSLNIENKLYIKTSNHTNMTMYLSNELNIQKIYKESHFQNLPSQTITIEPNSDLVIKGLGFINIKNAAKLTIYSEYLHLIEVRPSLFQTKGK